MTASLPPYRRIAEAIRGRIDDGELAPGDRVPSARQIRDEWGVALATATKALTTLRHEGLVVTRPRTATVVAPRRQPARTPGTESAAARTPGTESAPARTRGAESANRQATGSAGSAGSALTRADVVAAAIAIADAEGLDAVSMRGVAARLGAGTMSLYAHVSSKADLVLLMADAAFGELGYPSQPPSDRRQRLELGLRTLWALFRRHPWLANAYPPIRPVPLANLMVHSEWAFRTLDGLGLDAVTMRNLVMSGYNYVQGMACNLEREAQAEAATGLSQSQWVHEQQAAVTAALASGRYPTFAKVARALGGDDRVDLDDLFEFGLAPLLDGWQALIERTSRSRARGRNVG